MSLETVKFPTIGQLIGMGSATTAESNSYELTKKPSKIRPMCNFIVNLVYRTTKHSVGNEENECKLYSRWQHETPIVYPKTLSVIMYTHTHTRIQTSVYLFSNTPQKALVISENPPGWLTHTWTFHYRHDFGRPKRTSLISLPAQFKSQTVQPAQNCARPHRHASQIACTQHYRSLLH